jgi:hypothetical protein
MLEAGAEEDGNCPIQMVQNSAEKVQAHSEMINVFGSKIFS